MSTPRNGLNLAKCKNSGTYLGIIIIIIKIIIINNLGRIVCPAPIIGIFVNYPVHCVPLVILILPAVSFEKYDQR